MNSLVAVKLLLVNTRPAMRAEYASALALSGETNKAQTELNSLIEMSKQRYISAYHIAAIYVGLKDKERAFEWLERAFQDRADWMAFLNVDPRFDSLHSDPRFVDLLRRKPQIEERLPAQTLGRPVVSPSLYSLGSISFW